MSGDPIPIKGRNIIEVLEEALVEARRGDYLALAVCYVAKTHTGHMVATSQEPGRTMQLVGSIVATQYDIIRACKENA
jgi:hypothetical protein